MEGLLSTGPTPSSLDTSLLGLTKTSLLVLMYCKQYKANICLIEDSHNLHIAMERLKDCNFTMRNSYFNIEDN